MFICFYALWFYFLEKTIVSRTRLYMGRAVSHRGKPYSLLNGRCHVEITLFTMGNNIYLSKLNLNNSRDFYFERVQRKFLFCFKFIAKQYLLS